MTKRLPSMLCIGITFMLAACASDDPREGGFFGGLAGLSSGSYRERVAAETSALGAEETRRQEAIDSREGLDRTLKERRATAADLEGQVASLEQQVEGLDAEIAELNHQQSVTQEQVWKAETDVTGLLENIDRIETEQSALEQARALGADADQDTDPAQYGEPPQDQISDLRAYVEKLREAVDALKSARERKASGNVPGPVEAVE